ncbi:hypothetical protein [Cyanobium sp. NIES-981]|uniref:hypothetical protein n=1 Tax=Cyanobium sp. NIES-981 TaxID=1851505 RepID=UPI0007DCC029|nr:hypothetical protein [Cyanobium sp. NIES-981]SBO42591.1 conserved exported protein of unknown function [Cyanobium sp. NIES-981]
MAKFPASVLVPVLLLAPVVAAACSLAAAPLQAQTQTWQRRGAPPAAGSTVVPDNCAVASDGSITCDTRLEGGTGRPPASPRLELFPN